MAESVATLPGSLEATLTGPPYAPALGPPHVARSPLAHRADDMARAGRPEPYGVELREIPFGTHFNLRLRHPAPPERPEVLLGFPAPLALPRTPNTVHRAEDRTAVWLGPDEWLVVTPPGTAAETEGVLREVAGTAECAAYTDVSAHSTVLLLSGGRSRDVLRKVCQLDVHPRVFGSGACAQTLLARAARVLLVAERDPDGFLIFVRASFAEYVTDWLLDAMAEYAAGADPLTEER